jgi:hypothetical protein
LNSEALPDALTGLHCYDEADPIDVDLFSSPMKNITSLTFVETHRSIGMNCSPLIETQIHVIAANVAVGMSIALALCGLGSIPGHVGTRDC